MLRCDICQELVEPDELTLRRGLPVCDDCLDEEGYELWPDHEMAPPGMSEGAEGWS